MSVLNQRSGKKDAATETFDLHKTIKEFVRKWEVKKGDADKIGRVVFPNLDEQNRKALNQFIANNIDDR